MHEGKFFQDQKTSFYRYFSENRNNKEPIGCDDQSDQCAKVLCI